MPGSDRRDCWGQTAVRAWRRMRRWRLSDCPWRPQNQRTHHSASSRYKKNLVAGKIKIEETCWLVVQYLKLRYRKRFSFINFSSQTQKHNFCWLTCWTCPPTPWWRLPAPPPPPEAGPGTAGCTYHPPPHPHPRPFSHTDHLQFWFSNNFTRRQLIKKVSCLQI